MGAIIQAPGIYKLPADQYHADPCPAPSLSKSVAHVLIEQTPAHAWLEHPRLNPNFERRDAAGKMDIGTVAHDCLLEGGTGKILVIDPADYPNKNGSIPTGWTNKVIREARDNARKSGLVPILADMAAQVAEMVAVAQEYLETTEFAGILTRGKPEMSVFWQEGEIWCRSMMDLFDYENGVILDYKTTANAKPDEFRRVIRSKSYDLQDGFYRRGMAAITGKQHAFVFLAQEPEPPYACSLVALDTIGCEIADGKARYAINRWRECLTKNHWPRNYGHRINYVEPTAWEIADAEMRGYLDGR